MLKPALALGNVLFESPLPIVLGLVVVWALMRLVGARLTGERAALGQRLRTASWGLLLLAAVWFGVAWYVQTPAERLEITMRQLIAAIEEEDWEAFDRLTADDATGRYLGIEFTRAQVDSQLHNAEVRDITLLSAHVTYDPKRGQGVTAVQVRVDGSVYGMEGMDFSLWGIQWRMRDDGQWEAVRFQHEGSGLDEVLGG